MCILNVLVRHMSGHGEPDQLLICVVTQSTSEYAPASSVSVAELHVHLDSVRLVAVLAITAGRARPVSL